jgi:hypothetical protein
MASVGKTNLDDSRRSTVSPKLKGRGECSGRPYAIDLLRFDPVFGLQLPSTCRGQVLFEDLVLEYG